MAALSSSFRLPSDSLSKVNLGQSFAENDKILGHRDVVVITPAIVAALEPNRSKCFYVGRRGTGKTAISTHLSDTKKNVVQIHLELFSSFADIMSKCDFSNPRNRPYQSLVAAFTRAILNEAIYMNKAIGYCVVVCFRGLEIDKSYYKHIKYINDSHNNCAIVIPLTDKDLKVFIRQALNHRTKDDHIQNIYDEIIHKIS